MAGYSGTPLAKKLGIRDTHRLLLLNAPPYYFELFDDFPASAEVDTVANRPPYDVIHFFTTSKAVLLRQLPELRKLITSNGMIWVSWPKGKSKFAKDLNEDDIRRCMLSSDLVDVKVCAVDEDWSGLKGVIRLEKRT